MNERDLAYLKMLEKRLEMAVERMEMWNDKAHQIENEILLIKNRSKKK